AGQLEGQPGAVGVLQLHGDAALAPVDRCERGAHAVTAAPGPQIVTPPGALQLDDVRPEVGHQGGAVRAGDHPGKIENADAVEHADEYNRAPSLRSRRNP